jgi:iron complex transport system substrate-binding protein
VNKKIFNVLLLVVVFLAACSGAQNSNNTNNTENVQTTSNSKNVDTNEDSNVNTSDDADIEESGTDEDTQENVSDDANNEGSATDEVMFLEFEDGMGRTVVLNGYPERIISISASTTEIIYALGAGDKVIGRDSFSIFPAEVESVEIVGDFFGTVPSEALLAAEPDLIIAGGIISEEQITTIEELGLTVYYQLDPVDFEGLYDNINAIGALIGFEEEATTYVKTLEARVYVVMEIIAAVENKPVVFVEIDATDPANPWTTGSGTFVDYILNTGGGQNAAADLEGAYAQMSSEALIEANPEVILLTNALYGITPEMVAERPGWDVIEAVQNDAVFPFDPYLFNVPGPRLVNGLEEVARLLHPELFE